VAATGTSGSAARGRRTGASGEKSDDTEVRVIEMHERSRKLLGDWADKLDVALTDISPVYRPATPERWNAGATKERIETTFSCEGRQFTAIYDGGFHVSLLGNSANTAVQIGEAIAKIEKSEQRAEAANRAKRAQVEKRRKRLRYGGIVGAATAIVAIAATLIHQAATTLPIEYSSGDKPDRRPCQAASCSEDGNFHWFNESFSTTFTTTGSDTFRSTLSSGPLCDLKSHWQITLDGVPWRSGDFGQAGPSIDLDVPLRGVREVKLVATAPPRAQNCFPEISWLAKG
jgi:hypothetical protein